MQVFVVLFEIMRFEAFKRALPYVKSLIFHCRFSSPEKNNQTLMIIVQV